MIDGPVPSDDDLSSDEPVPSDDDFVELCEPCPPPEPELLLDELKRRSESDSLEVSFSSSELMLEDLDPLPEFREDCSVTGVGVAVAQ